MIINQHVKSYISSYAEDVRGVRNTGASATIAEQPAPLPTPKPIQARDQTDANNFQRKIQPWDLLLEAEPELSRELMQVREFLSTPLATITCLFQFACPHCAYPD